MMSEHTFQVDAQYAGQRLDIFLTQVLTEAPSRNFVKKLLDGGCVRVNRHQIKSHHKVREGDQVEVEFAEDLLTPQQIDPEDIPLDIFYEDSCLLVINKPAGMLVHPAQGCYSGTLVNALLFHCRQLSDINGSTIFLTGVSTRPDSSQGSVNPALRPGIVHRLDRETSGLLVAAKDNTTHVCLARQFQKHEVRKHYLALVEGEIEFDEGIIDAPLSRHIYQRDKVGVQYTDEAREAVTYYRVVKRLQGVTLVDLFPKTGRTHQLRVHMSHIRHPILGDDKYGKKSNFPRLALHARALGFRHPETGGYIEFSCPAPHEFLEKVQWKKYF